MASSAPSHPSGTGAQSANVQSSEVGQVQQDLLQVELDAEKIRGLHPKADVPEHFITQDDMRSRLLAEMNKNYTREQARKDELEYWLLGYIREPGINLFQLQADLLSEQVVGLYDPGPKELFVLSGKSRLDPLARETLAHEFTHSLQDQYYDLAKITPTDQKESDRFYAVKGLIEGDATLSGLLYSDQFLSAEEYKKLYESSAEDASGLQLDRAPDVFREELLFPYVQGLSFVRTLYTRGGFALVNSALENPPSSTEQILHPEKYLQTPRDEPKPVGVPPLTDTLGAGWTYADTKTIGEFELGLLLRVNGVKTGNAAAEGWGGGQYDVYQNGADSLAFMGTVWDSVADAQGFEAALRRSMGGYRRIGNSSVWTDNTRYFTIASKRDKVYFVGGTNVSAVQNSLNAIK